MSGDIINALFEFCGSIAVWQNVATLLREKKVRGVSLVSMSFFTAWGFWNIWYYPSLGQVWSAYMAAFLCLGNLTWVALAIRWRNA